MGAGLPDGTFWRFSVATYARPGVEAACLALQDRHGADVNLVLLALWLAARGQGLTTEEGGRLAEIGRDWQEPIVAPLRAVRRRLKQRSDLPWVAAVAASRGELARVELAMEQVEQFLLETGLGVVGEGRPEPSLALANLAAVGLGHLGDTPEYGLLRRATGLEQPSER